MATVKVLKRFWDRKRKVTREPGDVFTEPDKRVDEIQSRLPGYVDVIADAAAEPEKDVTETATGYSEMSTQELKALCAERGMDVPKRAKKAQLIALLEG